MPITVGFAGESFRALITIMSNYRLVLMTTVRSQRSNIRKVFPTSSAINPLVFAWMTFLEMIFNCCFWCSFFSLSGLWSLPVSWCCVFICLFTFFLLKKSLKHFGQVTFLIWVLVSMFFLVRPGYLFASSLLSFWSSLVFLSCDVNSLGILWISISEKKRLKFSILLNTKVLPRT